MISINASYTNLVNQRTLATNTKNLQKATERLSTGAKINSAYDDAAGLFVGSKLNSDISGMKVALDNTMLASNYLNIADGALSNVSENLMRMNTLATQACSGILSDDARGVLQAEMQGLAAQINSTISGATMNGVETIVNTGHTADLMYNIRQKSEEELISLGYVECTEENLDDTSNTKIYINSAAQLDLLGTKTNDGMETSGREFILSADIDLNNGGLTRIGQYVSESDTSKCFKGTFDGNGHIVSNLTKTGATKGQGLFGCIDGATIKNVGVENANISGGQWSGVLVGRVYETSTITNCYTKGSIVGNACTGGLVGYGKANVTSCYAQTEVKGLSKIGGLIGQAISGSAVNDCFATGNVSSSNINWHNGANVYTPAYTGGLIGYCYGTNVSNSYATGNIVGDACVGGLIGVLNTGNLSKCYATGNVTAINFRGHNETVHSIDPDSGEYSDNTSTNIYNGGAGGLVGLQESGSVKNIQNCYATGNVSGYFRVGGLTGYSRKISITNSYATGNVNCSNSKGGILIGEVKDSVSATGVFYNSSATYNGSASGTILGSGSFSSGTATGLSGSGFADSSNFSTWSTDIWDFNGRPTLKTQAFDDDYYWVNGSWNHDTSFQVGAGSDSNSSITYDKSIFLQNTGYDLSTIEKSRKTLSKLQALLTSVTQKQSYIGTQLNRLTGIATAAQMSIENVSAAKSTIMDADVAQEVANMTKAQILQQISTSVLTTSQNISAQIVSRLIN